MQNTPNWSRLGLGTGTLASLGRAASFPEVDKLVGSLPDLGVTVIDMADSYGSGECERLIGKALRGRRESFTVVTKAGYRFSNLPDPLRPLNQFLKKGLHSLGFRQQFTPSYLAKCVEGSLQRLGVDRLDAFLLHSPPLEVVESDALAVLFENLKRSGKTIMTGLSSENPAVIRAAISSEVFGVIETPASLRLAVAMQPLWNECQSKGIHVIGNHVFDPICLAIPEMTHELLMKTATAILPSNATVLCGSRNLTHLREASKWASEPMGKIEADSMIQNLVF